MFGFLITCSGKMYVCVSILDGALPSSSATARTTVVLLIDSGSVYCLPESGDGSRLLVVYQIFALGEAVLMVSSNGSSKNPCA